jgi:hypothetical protein
MGVEVNMSQSEDTDMITNGSGNESAPKYLALAMDAKTTQQEYDHQK